MDIDGVWIRARGITARGPEGNAFENVHLHVEPGALGVITGAAGTGRTSLLLALAGRMRVITGDLVVSGHVLPGESRAVRRLIRPARLRPGCELERSHRVSEAVTERRMISGVRAEHIADALALVGLAPYRRALVRELHPADRLLFEIALAAATAPAGLVVDDADAGLPPASRHRVWSALRGVAATGTTVLASATDPPSKEYEVCHLPARPHHRRHGSRV